MEMLMLLLFALVAVATFIGSLWLARKVRLSHMLNFANIAEGRYAGANRTYLLDEAVTTRYLIAKVGSDADHVGICDAADIPLGIITDEGSAAEELVNVQLLCGAQDHTALVIASKAIALGDEVVEAADGKVRDLDSISSETVYIIGRALSAASADGDVIEIAPCYPIQRVVA